MLAWGETMRDSRIGITKYNRRDLRTSFFDAAAFSMQRAWRLKVDSVMSTCAFGKLNETCRNSRHLKNS